MYVPVEHGLDPALVLTRSRSTTSPFPMSAPERMYFHRARNAIYHLFRKLGETRRPVVLVPDYHNGNEVLAIRATGAAIHFYRVGRDLEVDLDHLFRLCRSARADVLFAIHYFGWPQPMKELIAVTRAHQMILVEDCALSLLSETEGRPLGSFGQYATFCLYKTLPVPNGGVLVANGVGLDGLTELVFEPCALATRAGRTLELVFEWLRGRAYAPGAAAFALKQAAGRAMRRLGIARVPFGDIGFDLDSVNVAVAPLSLGLLERFDYEEIRQRRRANYRHLRERLTDRATLLPPPLEDGTCPLIFPLLVPDKPKAAAALQARGISAMEFWNGGDPETKRPEHADAWYLREHLVELPVHQDISAAQIDHMADQVLHLGLHF